MLEVAIRKNLGNRARFLLQDVASLQLPQPVELITCNFDSLNYLLNQNDLRRGLRRFYANLKAGGHLIFDVISDRPRGKSSSPYIERVSGPGFVFSRVMQWNPLHGRLTSHISILRNGRLHQEIHLQRAYPLAVVAALLSQARFTLLGAHDFHTLGPATNLSTRVVYVARKSVE